MVKMESYFCGTTIVGIASCILAMTNWGWFFWIPGAICLAIGIIALSFGPQIAAAKANVPIILRGPMLWVDTISKEDLLLPAEKYKDVTPEKIQSESMWFTFIEEAKNKIREKMASVSDDQLAEFNLQLFLETVNALVDNDQIHYRKLYLKETKFRRDLEEKDAKGREFPYKECWILTAGEWQAVFSREPTTIEVPYPDKDGFDVKINSHECMMLGIGMVQVTVPVIFIASSYDQAELLAKKILELDNDENSPIAPLSAREMTIKTQNAAINEFRLRMQNQDKKEDELTAERDSAIGENEKLTDDYKHVLRKSYNQVLEEKRADKIQATKKPGHSTNALVGFGLALAFIGVLFGFALATILATILKV